jgi:hypothetical protein
MATKKTLLEIIHDRCVECRMIGNGTVSECTGVKCSSHRYRNRTDPDDEINRRLFGRIKKKELKNEMQS